jgi:alkanesulfonate monooxygenase SsuD/methylene tetrahydromethanopterin reductase-like flavin-dependent oxidoreductase (luciferase family)
MGAPTFERWSREWENASRSARMPNEPSIAARSAAVNFPTPKEASAYTWTEEDLELVADRVDTQFVGSPGQVADKLEQLRDATDADELLITTITHDHGDRVRSYQLLASEWQRR